MAQKRILKRDASTGRISEGVSTDTYFSADPGTSSDLTTKNYSDSHLAGQGMSAGSSAGQLPIFNGTSWVPGDPLVQGLFPPGTNTSTGNAGSPINPVLIGGSDYLSPPLSHDLKVDTSGQIYFGNTSLTVISGTAANLKAEVVFASPQHVIADSGSTTVVSGNVTVVQGTGSNLHTVLDAGSNVIGHVITDTGSTTVVTGTVTVSGTVAVSNSFALDASVNGILVTQGSTTSGQSGPLIQGAVTTNAPSYTTAKTDPLSLDVTGNLRVSVKDSPANTNKFLVTADAITFASPQHVIADTSSSVIGHVIVDSGSITVTGSDIQYADNAASGSTPTGTLAAGWDSSNSKVRALKVDASQNLNVNVAASALNDPAECVIATTTAPSKILIVGGKSADGTPVFNPIPLAVGSGSVIISGAVTTSGTVTATVVTTTTGSAPTAATVGVASASAVIANASRKGLVLTNTSANTISLGFGANAAVLNSGITLVPNSVFVMDSYTFSAQAVNAIASAASSNLAVQEMT